MPVFLSAYLEQVVLGLRNCDFALITRPSAPKFLVRYFRKEVACTTNSGRSFRVRDEQPVRVEGSVGQLSQ